MHTRPYSSLLRVALIASTIAAISLGCAGRQRKSDLLLLQEKLSLQSTRVSELELENAELRNELNELESGEALSFETENTKALLENRLAGTGVTVQATDWQIKLSLPSAILFDTGKTTLSARSKTTLKKVAGTINADFPDAVVRVEGHTDNVPIKKTKKKFRSNWELSAARAATVAHYFVNECRFDPKRIYIAGFGEYRPVASNRTKAGRKKNRRVEIVILTRENG